jgi:hypothetical protein
LLLIVVLGPVHGRITIWLLARTFFVWFAVGPGGFRGAPDDPKPDGWHWGASRGLQEPPGPVPNKKQKTYHLRGPAERPNKSTGIDRESGAQLFGSAASQAISYAMS